ncbi:hypothetical protein ENUP19_0161G0043 [Entamoeba nuttalli]|uniref:Uncharacterized protein n=1 Tax=Entamoeba nuttalli TaxID=412467 RepID=A0ABQ0DLR0_9EUKA
MIVMILLLLFINLVSSQFLSIKSHIDESKIKTLLRVDGEITSKGILLTTESKKDGLISTIKTLPTNFQINGKIKSDGIGKGFALWLTTKPIVSGNNFGGKFTESSEGIYVKVPTDSLRGTTTIHNSEQQLSQCTFPSSINFESISFELKYTEKTNKLIISIGKDKGGCEMTYEGKLKHMYFAISALDDKNGGNHQIKSLEIIDLKKKTKSTKELLGNDKSINGLNFGFTENELFSDGDNIDLALQKMYSVLGKVQQQASKLDKLNDENSNLMKIIVNGAKHLNEMLKSQELIIDTSDILVDVDTFMERLRAIEEITGTTTTDLKILISTTIKSNKNIIKNNEASTHTFFWICFFLMQFCTVVLVLNLLKKKRDMNQRKAI